MKKLILATTALAALAGPALAASHGNEVKLGIMLGFTGPLESITPAMRDGAMMAIKEVSDSGALLGGTTVTAVEADSTCIDSAAATAAAERLITSDGVMGIMGADCSGVTGAVLTNVAMPNGVAMISPSATSPGLSTAEDNDLFFRTAPSDARQGVVMAEVLKEKGIMSVALTYTNNDYGKGLADSFQAAYEEAGGSVTLSAAHEDGKADYSAEVAALASAGGDMLVVAGYVDQGGRGMIQAALDTGAFDAFFLPDGMYGDSLVEVFGDGLDNTIGSVPGNDSPGNAMFTELAGAAGFDPTSSYTGESYDAAALLLLAMQAAGATDAETYKTKVMDVANAPGEKIYPGELQKALELIAAGEDIDYVGATAVELIGSGEAAGNFRIYGFEGGERKTQEYR
ncbi:ABC transporter substrate-binding protein [Vannielia litorea]|uniref:Amino acid/amide ABC transporter substrate-binding protein, HAAT family n=1 Tax=Vannielia litorea TaxID=1217970 RepID=A0A1N6F8C6_9RHOB|nr:ABC transporter substrate-binding protein [Vannielia litorea]SIN91467.1 amino acid/amide ABC transporter substrate-binding protein, HAAT family [Vannielia litorea]